MMRTASPAYPLVLITPIIVHPLNVCALIQLLYLMRAELSSTYYFTFLPDTLQSNRFSCNTTDSPKIIPHLYRSTECSLISTLTCLCLTTPLRTADSHISHCASFLSSRRHPTRLRISHLTSFIILLFPPTFHLLSPIISFSLIRAKFPYTLTDRQPSSPTSPLLLTIPCFLFYPCLCPHSFNLL